MLGTLLVGLGLDRVLGPLRWRAQDLFSMFTGRAEALASSPTRLSAAELEDLIAFAELLVEGRPLAAVEREALVGEIEARSALGQDGPALYRTTVRVLERLAGRRFSSLDVKARLDLMTRHRLTSSVVRPGDDVSPYPEDLLRTRTGALKALISDYYRSSAGWAVVGYDTPPGRCGDLARYTRAEA